MCIDVHVLSVIKASENYDTIAEGMKGSLDQINRLLQQPHITINDEIYDVELFLCSDYKVHSYLYTVPWCKHVQTSDDFTFDGTEESNLTVCLCLVQG